MRLDPYQLPARYSLPDGMAGLPELGAAEVYLDRETAVMERRLGEAPRRISVPISAYRGIAARVEAIGVTGSIQVTLELLHFDKSLSVVLMQADDMDDVVADWQAWSRQFGLPLLMIEPDGTVRKISGAANRAQIGQPGPRRRSSVLRGRRPRFLMRRRPGLRAEPPVWSGEREIIART